MTLSFALLFREILKPSRLLVWKLSSSCLFFYPSFSSIRLDQMWTLISKGNAQWSPGFHLRNIFAEKQSKSRPNLQPAPAPSSCFLTDLGCSQCTFFWFNAQIQRRFRNENRWSYVWCADSRAALVDSKKLFFRIEMHLIIWAESLVVKAGLLSVRSHRFSFQNHANARSVCPVADLLFPQ